MASSASTSPTKLTDADLYEHFRDRGLTHQQAVLHVERRRGTQTPTPSPSEPSASGAALLAAGQTATSGFADELIGQLYAAHGWGNADSVTNDVRQQTSGAMAAHPVAGVVGSIGGGVVNPLNYLLGPLTKGLSAAATGATYGAVQGSALGAGMGETPGERQAGAVMGGITGGAFGLGGGWLVGKIGRPAQTMWKNLRGAFTHTEQKVVQTLGKDVAPETVQQVQEAAHRAFLEKQGFPQGSIDQLMDQWRAGGLPKTPPAPPQAPAPPVLRPGESVTQIAPNGYEVHGTRATPPAPTEPPFWEQVRGPDVRDLGKGKTLPYYPRGGRVEQSMAPYPTTSPQAASPLAANQTAAFVEYLKAGMGAGDVPARVGTLKALGVIGDSDEAALLQMLGVSR